MKTLLAVLAVYAAWSALDFVLHGMILASAYAVTPQLWRPMAEMKTVLLHGVVLITAAAFVNIYALLISEKSVKRGVQYGLLFGVGTGISLGYGSFAVMPLPYSIAFGWFIGTVVKAVVAGWITGMFAKKL